MGNFSNDLARVLLGAAEQMRAARLPPELADRMAALAAQIQRPCVLAVVGRAKAGKSTFINALLRDDLAKVGVTETTATINFFCYGTPPNPAKPIRCYWQGGRYEDVDRGFLDGLQGNDADTLRKAAGIERLEYLLPNELLREVTLVDTPGTAAVVDEHQDRVAEFLHLRRQLRDSHTRETERCANEADAVIYLIGAVARADARDFLEEFGQATGGRARALNAVGVMAKTDLQPEVLARRHDLAAKVAEQLRENLSTVVPVSAGIRRSLDRLQEGGNKGLVRLMTKLRQIPPARLEKLLDSDELYEMDFADCPVSAAERQELRGDMPWGVFTTLARVAARPDLSGQAVVEQLGDLAGFGQLWEVLERHFFRRARLLRRYRIIHDARRVLNDLRYKHHPEYRQRDREDEKTRDRFLHFIRAAGGDPAVARQLEAFVTLQLAPHRAERLEAIREELDRQLSVLFHDMDEHTADFGALEQLERHGDLFTPAELAELRHLLGLYGLEVEKRLAGAVSAARVIERQQHWEGVREGARSAIRTAIAARAESRYGVILRQLMDVGDPAGSPTRRNQGHVPGGCARVQVQVTT